MFPGLELCEPSLRLTASVLAGLVTVAGELLLLAVALGCHTWRALLGVGAAPLTLFLSYGYHTDALFSMVFNSIPQTSSWELDDFYFVRTKRWTEANRAAGSPAALLKVLINVALVTLSPFNTCQDPLLPHSF